MSGMDHPWEESRGMGFSYGYNRAEQLKDYHTGRELVIMLVDTVSRGGNLLLDIGPDARRHHPRHHGGASVAKSAAGSKSTATPSTEPSPGLPRASGAREKSPNRTITANSTAITTSPSWSPNPNRGKLPLKLSIPPRATISSPSCPGGRVVPSRSRMWKAPSQ